MVEATAPPSTQTVTQASSEMQPVPQ
jgi:hypothetical protein